MTTDPSSSDPQSSRPSQGSSARRRRRWFVLGGIGMGAFIALLAGRSLAHGFRWHGHHGGHCLGTEAQVRERMGHRIDYDLDRLDATDLQRAEIHAIVDELSPELYASCTQGQTLGQELHDALGRADGEGIEAARKRGLALLDLASKTALDGVQRALAQLDEEQRARLQSRLSGWHH